jgi:hypothetical protein
MGALGQDFVRRYDKPVLIAVAVPAGKAIVRRASNPPVPSERPWHTDHCVSIARQTPTYVPDMEVRHFESLERTPNRWIALSCGCGRLAERR